MLKNRKLILLLLLCFGLVFHSCTHSKNRSEKITIASGQIPPDMATEKFILIGRLYERGGKSYNKHLAKEFATYTGESVLAMQSEIDAKYTPENGYRYVLDYDVQYHGTTGDIEVKRFYIYDQQTDKKYTRNFTSSFWALQIRYYLLAIDEARLK